MKSEELIKIIDFWQKNVQSGDLQPREVFDRLDLKGKEIVDLVGVRRSGKSSLLKLIIRRLKLEDNFLFVNFEDPFFVTYHQPQVIEELVETYQEHFHAGLKFIFFDEIQVIDHWPNALRKLRDAERYKIFITGSSAKLLSRELGTLLTGRHVSSMVYPLSFREFLGFGGVAVESKKDLVLLDKKIARLFTEYSAIGGFPEVVITKNQELLKNYFFDILQKDIVMRYNLREKHVLEQLAVYVVTNAGKLTSLESLKQAYHVSYELTRGYLEYLREALLIYELSQFSYSLKKQAKSLKKFYCADQGLANAVSFRFSEDRGRVLENIVFLELLRRGGEIYYYKSQSGHEVDFLTTRDHRPDLLIQVAWSLADIKTRERELKSLQTAMHELQIKQATVLTYNESDTIRPDQGEVTVMPVYQWLLSNS